MAQVRTRKNKENPHYGFLVSWEPKASKDEAVKRESFNVSKNISASIRHKKNADSLAQEETSKVAKKGIVRSLIRISLILILELVIYLAWTKYGIK